MAIYTAEEAKIDYVGSSENLQEILVCPKGHPGKLRETEEGLYACVWCVLDASSRDTRVDPDDWDKDDPYERSHSGVGLVQTDKGDRYV